jgi:hypothetical protein
MTKLTREQIEEFKSSPEFAVMVREAAALRLADEARAAEALSTTAPGPLAEIFDGAPIEVRLKGTNGAAEVVVLREMVHSDWQVLRRIESPFLKQITEAAKPEGERAVVHYEDDEVYEAVFVFTKRPSELRELLAKGRPAFREAAAGAIGDRLPAVTTPNDLVMPVVRVLARAVSTRVDVEAVESDGENPRRAPQAVIGA